ncbi:aminoglycoside phosphotransferase family protein [Streptomyces sp. NPDC050617]|uniref:aminoglycoside phosphotransferase family protein n=1 Tax=Streptomyces sp. NPDC050617 TaxID=3154628 RepID=UPI00342FC465
MRELAEAVHRITGRRAYRLLQDRPGRCVVRVTDGDGSPSVIKFDVRPERSAREGAVLTHLAEGPAAHLVPAVERHGLLPDGTAFLQTEAVGPDPAGLPAPPGGDEAVGRQVLGARVRILHRALVSLGPETVPALGAPPSLTDFASAQARLLVSWGALPARAASRLRERLETLPRSRTVVHGDLKREHVFHDRAGVRFIDWADVRVADPMWDIAVLTLDDVDHTPDLLRGYGADAHAESVTAQRLVRAMSDVTWARSAGRPAHGPLTRLRDLLNTP